MTSARYPNEVFCNSTVEALFREVGNAARWTSNHPGITTGRPALIEGGTILEVHGDPLVRRRLTMASAPPKA